MQLIEFGSIMNMAKGKKPVNQSPEKRDGFLPYVDIKAFETNTVDNYTDGVKCLPCEEGDILIVCDGSRSGLVGKAINGYVGSTLAKITADGMTQNYLYYFLQGKYALLNTKKKGTGTPHLNPDLLKKQMLIVPSIPEQKRIVTHIEELFSELDKAVETLQTTKQQLAVYRQAVLQDAFAGKFTQAFRSVSNPEIREKLQWASEVATDALPNIPNSWKYVALSQLGDLGRGKSKHRPRNDAKLFEDGKYPFLQTSEVKAATKYITEYKKMYGEFGLSQSKLWPKGTLCITIAANIAETAFLGIDACFPDSVVGFTPYDVVLPEYIKYFIESQKLRLWAFAPATAQKNINLDTLENLIVPYCAIEEQQELINQIESRLTTFEHIEQTVDTALAQADSMRQSILKQAFEGGF